MTIPFQILGPSPQDSNMFVHHPLPQFFKSKMIYIMENTFLSFLSGIMSQEPVINWP